MQPNLSDVKEFSFLRETKNLVHMGKKEKLMGPSYALFLLCNVWIVETLSLVGCRVKYQGACMAAQVIKDTSLKPIHTV